MRQLPRSQPDRPPRWRSALAVALAVVAGHAWLLDGWPAGPPAAAPVARVAPAVLQTRQIVPPAPAHAAAPPPSTVPAESAPLAVAAVVDTPAPPVPSARPAQRVEAATVVELPATMTATVAVAAAAPPAAADSVAIPVYTTTLPPAARLQYALRRGALSGNGQLSWLPGDSQYELTLEGRVLGAAVIEQTSRGGFDAAGIAPVRFVDRRRGRDAQAANFQRERGLVSFSGPEQQTPLWPGAQDRLSWMLQLPAIVAAEPARFAPGGNVTLFVVGARGDAGAWTFSVVSRDTLMLPSGPVAAALHLRREPRRAYDTLVDVWLDPARHHLPVKVRLGVAENNDSTELTLQSLELP